MRSLILLFPLLLLGCGQPSGTRDSQVFDVAEEPTSPDAASTEAARTPGIDVTAAPGVAFNYRYAFRLPSVRISPVQERHAQMCERLGLARCRITGMRYTLENERDVSGMLALKLDPAIARAFGRQATDAVAKAQGMLVEQEISGVDAGAAIAGANRSEAQIRDELARIEAELRRPRLSNAVRDGLLAEAAELRGQTRAIGATRDADRESLARTPMVFNYGSGSLVPGFDTTSPLRDALTNAAANFLGALVTIVTVVAALLPWALLLLLGLWLWRRFRPRWPTRETIYGRTGHVEEAQAADQPS